MIIILARNWWAVALRGLFALLFGVLTLAWPRVSLAVLVLLFGAYVLVDGIFAIVAAVGRASEGRGHWWPLLLEGLIGAAAGILTFVWPAITALVLLYLIVAWGIATGVFEIVAAVRLRKEMKGEWLLALGGVLSIVFGVLLFLLPGAGLLALAWLIGVYAVVFGVLLLSLGFRLRGRSRRA